MLAAAVEAALAGWLSWLHTDEWNLRPARPGLIVAARRAATIRAIRAGGVVARDGGCLGVAAGSGARITLSWAEAAGSVAVCGSAAPDVLTTGFQLVHAAVRRRKPVLAVDHTADPALAAQLAAVCAAAGVPLLVFGADAGAGAPREPGTPRARGPRGTGAGTEAVRARAACYEPFRHGSPGQRAALITAMLSWDGPGRQYRRSCVSYLDDVFELLDAAPGDPRVPVLDDVIHLLNPVAMRARMEYVPAGYPRREVLAERVRVSASLVTAEPATIAGLSRQLRELRESPFGRWLRPSPGGQADIDLGRAVADRAVVLFRLGEPAPAESSAMLTRLICQDLLAVGAARIGPGADGDGLIWLAECAALPRQPVTDLIARGRPAGLPVLAATTSAPVAADLADLVNVVVAHRMADSAAARRLSEVAAAAAAGRQPSGRDPDAGIRDRKGWPPTPPPCAPASSSWPCRTRPGWSRAASWSGPGCPRSPGTRAPPRRGGPGRAHDVCPSRPAPPGLAVRDGVLRSRAAAAPSHPAGSRTAQPGLGGRPAPGGEPDQPAAEGRARGRRHRRPGAGLARRRRLARRSPHRARGDLLRAGRGRQRVRALAG